MKKILKHLFFLFGALFIATGFTGAYFTDSVSVTGNDFSTGTWDTGGVVLNEIMAHPTNQNGNNPDGEWVELYNTSSADIDVAGWTIRDSTASNNYVISSTNTHNGTTVVPAGGWLAVYKNGAPIFNDTGDTVRLMNGSTLIDEKAYDSSTLDKTWSRMPDGADTWSDGHNSTPGAANV